MDRIASSMLAASAIGAATLTLATPSSAQQPGAGALGEAQLLPAEKWEWAIGRWEGNLLTVGTSAGSMGLNKSPRLLLIDKVGNGVTCRFLYIPPPSDPYPPSSAIPPDAGLTKRCVIRPNGISLTTSISAELELSRSGPDGLQGTSKSPYARGAQAPGLGGIQVHMNRVR
jgi:hypothetical protein